MRKVLLGLLAMSACSSNSTTPGDDGPGPGGSDGGGGTDGGGGGGVADRIQDYDDVAASVGANLASGDFGAIIDSVNMSYGRMPDGFALSMGPDYLILDGARGGLAVRYKVYCRDDLDAITSCNGLENHAHVKPTYSGTMASIDGVQRTAAWIVRDFNLPEIRIGGTGTEAFSSHFATGDYVLTMTDNLDHVRFPPTVGAPTSGGIDLVIHAQRNRAGADPADRLFDVTARIDFDGSDTASLVLDGTETFTLALSTGITARL